jgi:hypothetical protein
MEKLGLELLPTERKTTTASVDRSSGDRQCTSFVEDSCRDLAALARQSRGGFNESGWDFLRPSSARLWNYCGLLLLLSAVVSSRGQKQRLNAWLGLSSSGQICSHVPGQVKKKRLFLNVA